MKKSVEVIIKSFERLSREAKREAASEILRRTAKFKLPPLSNATLVEVADNIFLKLDKEESRRG